jgi:hypothetical protein
MKRDVRCPWCGGSGYIGAEADPGKRTVRGYPKEQYEQLLQKALPSSPPPPATTTDVGDTERVTLPGDEALRLPLVPWWKDLF